MSVCGRKPSDNVQSVSAATAQREVYWTAVFVTFLFRQHRVGVDVVVVKTKHDDGSLAPQRCSHSISRFPSRY